MDDTDEAVVATAGERLRAAREERSLSLEEVAAQTRIPRRHLESLESSEWDKLPAPTYTIGFAKSYASAVGLDRNDIGDQLRAELGGARGATADTEVFEAADPARAMPKWLVFAAIVAVIILVAGLSWYNRRSLEQPADQPAGINAVEPVVATATQPQAPAPSAQGPVVVSATEPAWVQVKDQGRTLFEGMMSPGQTFAVPATATAPLLKAGKPEALRITVGNNVAPPVGPAGRVASNVSLRAADLMRAPQSPSAGASAPSPEQPQPH
ncbi:helix-turn-helix domain-containing protein [Sphingomonas piscis]|uniref:Helix-turn-helix domain-containing protein n=1 Tax=Sphingomonas piscis TaxID=2714943 RepID=A0A6G7YNR9_9SPHN|nr:RodZ domain-containing protein [Sphingomonas piscis]QIK78390.1 helix-turn-helix domain-containing protein [Sphingomonas piscis]